MRLKFLAITVAYLSVALSHFVPNTCWSESKTPPLATGMHYAEVLALWGQPNEKQEKEPTREDIWIYRNSVVTFHEGRVTSWKSTTVVALPSPAPSISEQAAKDKRGKDSVGVEDILTDIMKNVPSDDSPEPPAGRDNRNPNPLPGVGMPPGMPPAFPGE